MNHGPFRFFGGDVAAHELEELAASLPFQGRHAHSRMAHDDLVALPDAMHRRAPGDTQRRVNHDPAVHFDALDREPLPLVAQRGLEVSCYVESVRKHAVLVCIRQHELFAANGVGSVHGQPREQRLHGMLVGSPHQNASMARIRALAPDMDFLDLKLPTLVEDLVQHLWQKQGVDDVALKHDGLGNHSAGASRYPLAAYSAAIVQRGPWHHPPIPSPRRFAWEPMEPPYSIRSRLRPTLGAISRPTGFGGSLAVWGPMRMTLLAAVAIGALACFNEAEPALPVLSPGAPSHVLPPATAVAEPPGASGPASAVPFQPSPLLDWIDTHTHLQGQPGERGLCASPECVDRALALMDQARIGKAVLMPPPGPVNRTEVEDRIVAVAKQHPERFAFLLGGASLNPMIQEAVRAGEVSAQLSARFVERAGAVVGAGAAGFGEMTALHLSFNEPHPYEAAPPDHSLFLLLADLAAQYDLPIDLHLEIVAHDTPTPRRFRSLSPNNPSVLSENLTAFERLLAHNRAARVVWAHVGWDNTGHMTVALLRRLLETHPNLYLQLKPRARAAAFPENEPLDGNGHLRPEWLELIEAFPDRFLLGTDTFFNRAVEPRAQLERAAALLRQLSQAGSLKVAAGNAERMYRLASP